MSDLCRQRTLERRRQRYKGVRPKPLWRRTEGYRTSEHGEGGDCWVSRLNAAKEANDRTNAYMYAGENARQQRKGRK